MSKLITGLIRTLQPQATRDRQISKKNEEYVFFKVIATSILEISLHLITYLRKEKTISLQFEFCLNTWSDIRFNETTF